MVRLRTYELLDELSASRAPVILNKIISYPGCWQRICFHRHLCVFIDIITQELVPVVAVIYMELQWKYSRSFNW